MSKRAKFDIEEIEGSLNPDLESGQRAVLPLLAGMLAGALQELLASGELVQINGEIIPSRKVNHDKA